MTKTKSLLHLGKILGITITSMLSSGYVGAAYYDTLPKGVRMIVMRQVKTGEIKSAYNRAGKNEPYFFKIDLNAQTLEDYNTFAKSTFEQIKSINKEAYDEFSLGQFEAQGVADVSVKGAGVAVGITNRLTAYGAFPFYDARVDLQMKQTGQNNLSQVANKLDKAGNSSQADLIQNIANQFSDINITGETVQSAVVNGYNYQPLGNWQAQGPGDFEVGLIYRLTDWDYSGLALSGGVVLPTGREDDPDMLQDFAFGDGQTDLFVEFGGGVSLPNTSLSFNSYLRYTYQFAHNRRLRLPESEDFPYSAEDSVFEEKLGNMLNYEGSVNYQFSRSFGISAAYLDNYRPQSQYTSEYTMANTIHADETERREQFVRVGTHFSTVPLYKSGDFFLPFAANITAQKMIGGLNSPSYSRFDFELRFFF